MPTFFYKDTNPANSVNLKKGSKVFVIHQSTGGIRAFEGEITRALKSKCGVTYSPNEGHPTIMEVDTTGHKIELHRSSVFNIYIIPFTPDNIAWVQYIRDNNDKKKSSEEASYRVMQKLRNVPIQSDKWIQIEEFLKSLN